MTNKQNQLYQNVLDLDDKTGLPKDYESFFAAYWPLMLTTAERRYIPENDRADAAQEVQIKFWLKNGLDLYDPALKTKFATFLRNWAGMFMLQERDKSDKASRYALIDAVDTQRDNTLFRGPTSTSVEYDYVHSEFIETWISEAEETLQRMELTHLLPVLRLCVKAAAGESAPSRAQIAEAAGVKISKATPSLKELRAALTEAGMGIESLFTKHEF